MGRRPFKPGDRVVLDDDSRHRGCVGTVAGPVGKLAFDWHEEWGNPRDSVAVNWDDGNYGWPYKKDLRLLTAEVGNLVVIQET